MLSWWLIIILLIYFFVCILLMGVILIQSGKGGGLSSLGSSSGGISDALSATGAERTLNKITTGIAVSFMLLAIFLSIVGSRMTNQDETSELFENVPAQSSGPAAPVTAPPTLFGEDANEEAATPATTPNLPFTVEIQTQPADQPEGQPEGQAEDQPGDQTEGELQPGVVAPPVSLPEAQGSEPAPQPEQ